VSSALHAAGQGYDPDVAPTESTIAARKAIARMTRAQEALDAARVERDAAIVAMYVNDDMTPPQIHRALGDGVSTSLVRLTLRVAGVL
jgi:hypothetical protein